MTTTTTPTTERIECTAISRENAIAIVGRLAEAADVHRRLAAGDIRGKFVLRPTANIPATP